MSKYLHMLVAWMARVHDYIMTFNDRFETHFTDKELHFLVIGALGLALLLIVYPLFKWLANRNRVLAVAWIYVATVLVVLTFAIEIGQQVTGAGSMDFGDIVAGMGGFLAVTAVIAALRLLLWAGQWIVRPRAMGKGGRTRNCRGPARTTRAKHELQIYCKR